MTNFDRIIRCCAAPYNKEGFFQNVSKLIEVKSKLTQVKPKTLGQAIRIDGITPAAIIILLSYIKKLKYKATA